MKVFETGTIKSWQIQIVEPKWGNGGILVENPKVKITPPKGVNLNDLQRSATLSFKVQCNNYESTIYKRIYVDDVPDLIFLDQQFGDWSEILLTKQGNTFFYREKTLNTSAGLLITNTDATISAYVEFNDNNLPSKITTKDGIILISNYTSTTFDIAVIDARKNINIYRNIDRQNLSNISKSNYTKALSLSNKQINVALDALITIVGIGGGVAVGAIIGVPVVVGVIAAIGIAAATYITIVDVWDAYVAPAPDDMLMWSGILSMIPFTTDRLELIMHFLGLLSDELASQANTAEAEMRDVESYNSSSGLKRYWAIKNSETQTDNSYYFYELSANICPKGYFVPISEELKKLSWSSYYWRYSDNKGVNPNGEYGVWLGENQVNVEKATRYNDMGCLFFPEGLYWSSTELLRGYAAGISVNYRGIQGYDFLNRVNPGEKAKVRCVKKGWY